MGAGERASVVTPAAWPSRGLLTALTGGVPAWITLPLEALLGRDFPTALRSEVVLEVPASVLADQETVRGCRDWRDAGFRLAVCANPEDHARPALYAVADLVRAHLPPGPADGVASAVAVVGGFHGPLAVSGVDTMETQRVLRDLGVAYFHGRFYTTPHAVLPTRPSVSFATVARLLSMLERAELSDRAIEQELRADPALSLNLLRMANSAASGMRAVGSILHAIQIIGRNGLRRWLALLAVEGSVAGTAVERERRLRVLEQARFCEHIAEGIGLRRHANSLFLTGMLAALAPMTDASPSSLVTDLHVNSDVADALTGRGGLYAPVLALATAYANGEWRTVAALGQQLPVLAHLPAWYEAAIAWARESLART
ncbi:MAG: HDOD domain-containing protein [Gemmatimonadetes bacterium]|nr:HDOD domain-containing protein [Gemmatimonadota bacterium]